MRSSNYLHWALLVTIVLLLHFLVVPNLNPYYVTIIIYSGINIILAVSLNLINGFTGQFSMGHVGFMAVGAYLGAVLSKLAQASYPWLMESSVYSQFLFLGVLIFAGIGSGIVGYIVGLPSLRLKGDYLAVVTLGLGEIIRVLLLNLDSVGGARGYDSIPYLTNVAWVYLVVLFTIFFINRLIASSHGRRLLAVREDEIAAEAVGVNSTQAKVSAFVIGAFFAGIAGALFAHQMRFISPSVFDISRSFEIIIMVVLGGMGSISASVFAAVFLTVIREQLRELQQFTIIDLRMVIYSLLLIILMLTRPRGIFGTKELSDFLPNSIRKILGYLPKSSEAKETP